MNPTNIFKPIYEASKGIARLLGEIESIESLISMSSLYRPFLIENWQKWRQESVCSAFRLQKWGLEPEEIAAYLNGKSMGNIGAAKVQVRIKNYAAVLDYFHNLQPSNKIGLNDLGNIHARLRVGVGEDDMFAGQLRTRFTAIYKANKRDVKFYLPSPRELDGYLKGLLDWINTKDHDAHVFVRAAVAHHRLLELRPFQQDNGKSARLFFRRLLISNLYPWRALLPYESIFSKDSSQYYRLLDAYEHPHLKFEQRTDPKLTEWIVYHLEGISALLNTLLEQISTQPPIRYSLNSLNPRQKRALTYVKRYGHISNRVYREKFKVGRYTAFCDLKELVDKKFLIPSSPKGRSVVYYNPSE
jgi:Fic family protein